MSARFAAAAATGDPASLAAQCIAALPAVDGATLGILYTTEAAAAALPEITRALSAHTGIRSWVGGVGLGVCSAAAEVFDEPAAVARLFVAHAFENGGGCSEILAESFGEVGVDTLVFLLEGDGQRQDLPLRKAVKASHDDFTVLAYTRCHNPYM